MYFVVWVGPNIKSDPLDHGCEACLNWEDADGIARRLANTNHRTMIFKGRIHSGKNLTPIMYGELVK